MNALFAKSSQSLYRRGMLPALLILIACLACPAQATLTVDGGNYTVTDSTTGLVWDYCAYGRSGAYSCNIGSFVNKTWAQALTLVAQANTSSYKGFADWRLPNVNELESIVKIDASSPAIDVTAFPGTPGSNFWSSTTYTSDPRAAWMVNFSHGTINGGGKSGYGYVRLVRSGQSLASFDLLSQTIGTISFNPTSLSVGGTSTASATATSGLTVSFASPTPTICTVSGSTVTGVAAGTCSITASHSGNNTFAAATPVSQNLAVGLTNQTISAISFNPTSLSVGGTSSASATASSGLAVAFSSTTPTICTVSGSTVTGVATGTCTVSANQAGNANYSAATQVTQNITVSKASQTIGVISFSPTSVSVGGTTTASATASSGLGVTFSSSTPTICSVSGSTVTALAVGTCTVAANQAGNANYSAASQVTQNITVGQASQTIGTISFNPTSVSVGGTSTASATATSGLAVSFASTTPTICTVSGSTVTGIAAGTCSITASQSGNSTFAAATPVSQNLAVGLTSQTIGTVSFNPTSLSVGGTSTASATASSGLAVAFNSTTPTICTVSGSTVTGVAAGTCSITASQSGNSTFAAATPVSQNIAVGLTSQTISAVSFNPTSLSVGGTSTASATATSGLAVAFSSNTPPVCTVAGSVVTGVSAGTCTIAANQAGNAAYAAAQQVTQNITVTSANLSRLINISTRGQISTGDGVMIGGFIITGTANKKVLIRAIGPNLANFGIAGTLPDPKLELFEGSTLIGSNDNWQTQSIPADVAAITATGLAPANVAESALLVNLKPGVAYTAVVTGVNVPSGVGIVEVFEADHPEYQLINISTRGRVETGEGVMIGGFIIQGDAPKTVLIRAVGPNLANFGVSGVLADPMMEIYRSADGVKIASNDDWQTQTIAADVSAITATGLPPADPRESAILLTLPPGAYTAVVSGKNGGTGVGIVEVFAR